MKKKEVKDLFQKYYNRFYQFQKREWKKMWQEFLTLTKKEETKLEEKTLKRKNQFISYDIHGNKIEPDNSSRCPKCQTEINNVNTDIIIEESTQTHTVHECLNCGEKTKLKN